MTRLDDHDYHNHFCKHHNRKNVKQSCINCILIQQKARTIQINVKLNNIAPNFYYKQEQNEPIYTLAASAKVLVISV